jgi:multiple RNA-binding domain-containing protein 1
MFVNRTHVTFDAADDESSDDEEYQELPASKKAKKDDGEESNDDNADAMDVDATKSEDHLSLIKANMRSADDIERLIAEEEARAASGVPEEHPVVKSEENEGTKEGVKVDEGVKAEDDGVDKDGEKSDESIDIVDPAAETAAATTTDGKRKYDNVGTVEDLAETGRIFVRNLPFTTVEDDLFKLFSKYGQVSEVHISVDKSTKSSKGIGFVLFLMPQDAVKAFNELDGKIFQGRLMHLLPAAAVQRKEPKTANDQKFQTEFQKRKEQKMKELSGQDFNWNPLFIRADTVAQAMAAQYNVEKGDIYDRDSKVGVKMLLHERQGGISLFYLLSLLPVLCCCPARSWRG